MKPELLQRGLYLCFYCRTQTRHNSMLLSEWLLQQARTQGVGGGSVMRAIAGYGRHGVMHEEHFFELADDLPIKVEFLLHEDQVEALLDVVREANVDVTYAYSPANFAVLGKH